MIDVTVWVREGDRLTVRERTTQPGLVVNLGDAVLYFTPEKEAELLAALIERAPKLPLRAVPAVHAAPEAPEDGDLAIPRLDGLRRVMVEDFAPAVAEWLEQDRERFLLEASMVKRHCPIGPVNGLVIDLADAIARLPKAAAASPQDAA